jgi:hypothetical protein
MAPGIETSTWSRPRLAKTFCWFARGWSIASIALVIGFLIGEGVHLDQLQPAQRVGFLFFPVGISIGMIVAWWKEGLGGYITVASLLVFYALHLTSSGTPPKGWAWLAFAAPGFLFLASWYLARHSGRHKSR